MQRERTCLVVRGLVSGNFQVGRVDEVWSEAGGFDILGVIAERGLFADGVGDSSVGKLKRWIVRKMVYQMDRYMFLSATFSFFISPATSSGFSSARAMESVTLDIRKLCTNPPEKRLTNS